VTYDCQHPFISALQRVYIAEPTSPAVKQRIFRVCGILNKRSSTRERRQLGWNRVTIRKGMHELDSGICCLDAFCLRGRKRSEEHLPTLLEDIKALVDAQCQTDPTFKTQRLYTRLTAASVRKQLMKQMGYNNWQSPTEETIRCKMHQLGYHLTKVLKCKPKKRSSRPMQSSLS
jgi:Rhodopirellula transposase DDE domain